MYRMILVPSSDGELALSELGLCFDVCLGMYPLWLCRPIVARSGAVTLGRSQVHPTGVLAGASAICCEPTSPALAVARRRSIGVLQCLVLDSGIRVGRKGPDPFDRFAHGTSG